MTLVVGMARLGDRIKELIEAESASILGGAQRGAVHEARVVKRQVSSHDILDPYGMPPVVADAVGVRENTDPAFDQGTELDPLRQGLVHMIPFSIGSAVVVCRRR